MAIILKIGDAGVDQCQAEGKTVAGFQTTKNNEPIPTRTAPADRDEKQTARVSVISTLN